MIGTLHHFHHLFLLLLLLLLVFIIISIVALGSCYFACISKQSTLCIWLKSATWWVLCMKVQYILSNSTNNTKCWYCLLQFPHYPPLFMLLWYHHSMHLVLRNTSLHVVTLYLFEEWLTWLLCFATCEWVLSIWKVIRLKKKRMITGNHLMFK